MLRAYRRKKDSRRTSEWAETNAGILAIVFVVHKHSATADHCDLRLGEGQHSAAGCGHGYYVGGSGRRQIAHLFWRFDR